MKRVKNTGMPAAREASSRRFIWSVAAKPAGPQASGNFSALSLAPRVPVM